MAEADVSLDGAAEKAEEIKRAARPWVVRFGRYGYAAKGVVYVLIGSLAALAAFDLVGGGPTDSRGALTRVVQQPYGRALLSVVAFGLAGYAVWRVVMGVGDTEDKGSGLKGLGLRFGYACIGLVYAGLCYSAVQLVLGHGAGRGGDESARGWTRIVFAFPLGRWVVALAGLCVVGFGGWQCFKAFTAKFREKWKRHEMSARSRALATYAGRVGLVARGVVFGIIGLFLIEAAWLARAEEARGLGGALRALEAQPYGPYVLGSVALGLVAYGLYMFVEARYRRMVID